MKKKILLIAMVLILAMAAAAGCGKKEDTSAAKTTKTTDTKKVETKKTEEKQEILKTIGDKTDTAFEVKLTNATGQDITGISIKNSGDETYPDNMLKNADKFGKDESRIVYYTSTKAKEEATETGKIIPIEYTIQLTLADGTISELHGFPFEDIQEGKISLEEKLAYLTYKSVSTNQEVITLESEKAVKAQADAAAASQQQAEKDAAAAKAQADANAQAASAQPQTQSQPQTQEAAPETTYQPESQAPAAPAPEQTPSDSSNDAGAGQEEGCLNDGLFY